MENVQQGMKNFSLYKLPRDCHDYGISTTIQNFKMVFKKTFVFKWVNDRVHLIAEKGNAKCIL